MAPKRKSSVIDEVIDLSEGNDAKADASSSKPTTAAKKARVSSAKDSDVDASEPSSSTSVPTAPKSWRDIKLEEEDESGGVPVHDDCNDIRRKIRALQKTPGFKVTHWLESIGKINNNSFQRFMKASGPTGGATNGTFYSAYVYFEKVRIFEGKKKTAKRQQMEARNGASGMPLEDRRRIWVITGR